jgi:hypothetical protein
MRLFQMAFLMLLLQVAALPLASKDFAPCAPRSEAAVQMAQAAGWDSCQGIPSAEQVGIPAPPGAEISTVSSAGAQLAGIVLLSPAPMNEVVDFYKKSLTPNDGWKWNEVLGIFYQGESVSDALFLKIPSVRVSSVPDPSVESFLVEKAFRDKVKTKIEIHYAPPQAANSTPPNKG